MLVSTAKFTASCKIQLNPLIKSKKTHLCDNRFMTSATNLCSKKGAAFQFYFNVKGTLIAFISACQCWHPAVLHIAEAVVD